MDFLAKQQELHKLSNVTWCRAELWKKRLDTALQQGREHPKKQQQKEESFSAVTVLSAQTRFAAVWKYQYAPV